MRRGLRRGLRRGMRSRRLCANFKRARVNSLSGWSRFQRNRRTAGGASGLGSHEVGALGWNLLMSWVRIHDGAMQNLKITALTDSAFRLWVRGLAYCQSALTDGLIPSTALKEMGAKRKDVDQLSASLVPGRAPLWEAHEIGFKVHDYLAWNDCRDKVRERQDKAKKRRDEWETRRKRVPNSVPNEVPNTIAAIRFGSREGSLEEGTGEKPADSFTDPDVTERAGRFIDRYVDFYPKHRHGARYAIKPSRDYQAAVTLCTTWDDARLDKLAVCFLTTNHQFAASGSRTIPQFLALASWCDGELAKWEASQTAS